MKKTDSIFVKGLLMEARVGIYPAEKNVTQPVKITFCATYSRSGAKTIEDVLSYETAVRDIRGIVAEGHYDLLEALADKIMDHFFARPEMLRIQIDIEKPRLPLMAPDLFHGSEGIGISLVQERNSGN